MPSPSFVRVCARISTFKPSGEPPQGFCLVVDGQLEKWFLTASLTHAHLPNLVVLKSGPLPTLGSSGGGGGSWIGSWHRLKLTTAGSTVTGNVDGKVVGSVTNSTYTHGMVALGSGWHEAYYDNFSVTATGG